MFFRPEPGSGQLCQLGQPQSSRESTESLQRHYRELTESCKATRRGQPRDLSHTISPEDDNNDGIDGDNDNDSDDDDNDDDNDDDDSDDDDADDADFS